MCAQELYSMERFRRSLGADTKDESEIISHADINKITFSAFMVAEVTINLKSLRRDKTKRC